MTLISMEKQKLALEQCQKPFKKKFDVRPSKKYATRESLKIWNFYNVYKILFEDPKFINMLVYLPRSGAKLSNRK